MSQGDQEKSMDKKEIAEEEREKMLNAENTKHTVSSTAPDSESEEQKPKKKIPIGGIKMPGFCRTKSKEPCKVMVKRFAFSFFSNYENGPSILKRLCFESWSIYIRRACFIDYEILVADNALCHVWNEASTMV